MPDSRKHPAIEVYLDPASAKFYEDRLFDLETARFAGNDLNAPYVFLKERLAERGISVHTADRIPETASQDVVRLYVALSNADNYRSLVGRSDLILSACIAMECPVVAPDLYRKLGRAEKAFQRIVSWSTAESLAPFVGRTIDVVPFFWPQSFNDVDERLWKGEERDFLIMMNSNKLPALYHNELYTERLRALEFFSSFDEVDLYGVGWEKASHQLGYTWIPWTLRYLYGRMRDIIDRVAPDPKLVAARKVYRGRAESKKETLARYTFAICFENSILDGWITEKIFDCFHTGTVPIYWGAPNITDHIPAECFIDMRQFDDYKDLRSFLKSASVADIRSYKIAARDFIRSDAFYPFSLEAFAELFLNMIDEDTVATASSG